MFGLAVVGDGGSSTGEIHESMNIASVQKSPVLFLIENNYYAFSTPIGAIQLPEAFRSRGGIRHQRPDDRRNRRLGGVLCRVRCAGRHSADSMPRILECMTLRLRGHAAYDKGDYVSAEEMRDWLEPILCPARRKMQEISGFSEAETAGMEKLIEAEVQADLEAALACARPESRSDSWTPYAQAAPLEVEPYQAAKVKNGDAVNRAIDYLLAGTPTRS